MALQIIGFPRSNFVRSVRMVAEEKGVPYDLVAETPHSDAVKSLNPTGKIPVMRHDGLELSESLAIATYIDAAFDGPKLMPTKGCTSNCSASKHAARPAKPPPMADVRP